jgi:hypothetical protein
MPFFVSHFGNANLRFFLCTKSYKGDGAIFALRVFFLTAHKPKIEA